ncbi:MAG: C40 family peptidase [Proteobacteria bacterium]|nr:C40 family peptidase [Pseudomonadota bacterium]
MSDLEVKQTEKPKGGEQKSSSINKILTEARKYVDRRNPYAWGGKGEALTKANIDKLRAIHGEATFRHLTKAGDWGWAVGKSGMQCVDCSGMTQQVYQKAVGIDVGINTTAQRQFGKDIGVENALPGDLLVGWSTDVDGKACGHCGIMGDNGKLIEAKGRRSGCVNEYTPKEAGMTVAFHVVDYDGEEAGSNIKEKKNGSYILSSKEADAAIRYNRLHNEHLCKQILEVVGVKSGFVFDVRTVNKIAKWQKKNGIHADGQFSHSSLVKAHLLPKGPHLGMGAPMMPMYAGVPMMAAMPAMPMMHPMAMPAMALPMMPAMAMPVMPAMAMPMMPAPFMPHHAPMPAPHHHGPHHVGHPLATPPFMPHQHGPHHVGHPLAPFMPFMPVMPAVLAMPVMYAMPVMPLPALMAPAIYPMGPAIKPAKPVHKPAKETSVGGAAVSLAEKYLYSKTHKFTKDFIKGKPHLKHLVDVSGGTAAYNHGYDCNCANFVSAILQNAGLLSGHYIGVSALMSNMASEGYKKVSRANAKPGDIWINTTTGSHTEIVASNVNGQIKLIGSNNANTQKQRVTYDVNSGNTKGEFFTKA